jgi:hypothetical protein
MVGMFRIMADIRHGIENGNFVIGSIICFFSTRSPVIYSRKVC